ncbi:MAG: putative periplasmic serine endoprotease DegP-like precursor [Syntrophorhabdaceae bacterium PtaU1.Bin034]|nr:MAG: putative periplasmic serine endoprotease DegP-like precursor [Syntrophorhabdaceae bacterium PtaU1.Bin034]
MQKTRSRHKSIRRCCLTVVTIMFLFAFVDLLFAQPAVKRKAPADLSTAIVQVAKQNIPAVVHIDVMERQEVANPLFPFENDPFFRYFFGNPRSPKKFKRETRGVGTGMIIDSQGNILTNHHVAGGATKIEVSLSDGRKFPAKLVGSDPKTDLAVIRITAKEPLPHITFGDSDRMDVGEWVIAIGHPRGLDQTVTQGIISAKHRRGITDPTSYQDFLQTDAAINPGNSGGPLLNLYGEVIGVNTAIASQSGGSEGIGFAIPSNMAVHVTKTIIARGKVERGWLGIGVQDLTADLAKSLNVSVNRGAVVNDVVKGGPADRAGLKKNDVIVAFQGNEIVDGGSLRNLSAMTPIGQEVKLTVLRQGKKQDVVVKIGNLQEAAKHTAGTIKDRLGVEVRAITPKEAERFGLDPKQGVAVAKVDAKGPLGVAGFEPGDMILEINGQAVAGIDGFIELAGSLRPRQRVTLLAVDRRTGNTGTIQVVTK